MGNTPPNLIARGTIRPCRFVTLDASNDFSVVESDANSQIIGISQEGSNYPPLNDLNLTDVAADSGDPIQIYGDGDTCLLQIGGNVTRGNRLKSDADGQGVAIASTGTTIQQIGAVALQSGTSGQKIRVQVMSLRSERPAIS